MKQFLFGLFITGAACSIAAGARADDGSITRAVSVGLCYFLATAAYRIVKSQ